MHVEKTQLDTAAAEKRCGTMKEMTLTRSAPRERRDTKAENSRKNAEECVLEAKIYYQSSYNDSTNKIAYQRDTQVNLNLTLPWKIGLALRNANLNYLFMKKYASCKFLCAMTGCIGKIFFTRQEKKEKQNTYINMKDAAS